MWGTSRLLLLGLQNCWGELVWLLGFDETRKGLMFTFVLI